MIETKNIQEENIYVFLFIYFEVITAWKWKWKKKKHTIKKDKWIMNIFQLLSLWVDDITPFS